jgi:hypothetical protein
MTTPFFRQPFFSGEKRFAIEKKMSILRVPKSERFSGSSGVCRMKFSHRSPSGMESSQAIGGTFKL